ncbi:MAG TPA: lysophospholipid acyltransferase family protein [Acidimicrobiales bacterium]|jgi:long-chain acyl-CoA synthetase|nr:lysophospholipid acyltransferase family protein [Acidimicrobiales bacterium]
MTRARDLDALPKPTWPYRTGVRLIGDATRDYVVTPFIKHWITLTVEGIERLEHLSEPSIFIFNHSDDLDGPVTYASLPRRIRRRLTVAVGADILHDHRVLAFVIRLCYCAFAFARRASSRAGLNDVKAMIGSGRHVLLAPEGRLSTDGELLDFKAGIGMLAVKLGVPIVPMKLVGLSGTVPMHALWPKKHSNVTVHIGEPQRFGPDVNYRHATRVLRDAVASL